MCDGSVNFISFDIDLEAFAVLGSIADDDDFSTNVTTTSPGTR